MKKRTKGITICCKECKHIVIRYIKNNGQTSFDILCPYCHKLMKITMTQVTKINIKKLKQIIKIVK